MAKVKISFIMLLVAVLLLCNTSFFSPKNVYAESVFVPQIENDSFELQDGSSEFIKPNAWQVEAKANFNKQNVSYVIENAYDAQSYYCLSANEYTIKSEDYVKIDGSDDYVFGVKYITSSLENSCVMYLETFDSSNNLISTIVGGVESPTMTDTWLDTRVHYTANTNVSKIKIIIELNALDGDVGIDYVYGNKDVVKTNFGASISLQKGITSIRFLGRVDKAFYDAHIDNFISVGIVFAPTNAVLNAGEFTIDALGARNSEVLFAKNWNNQGSIDTDGYYEFACKMENMHAKEALTFSLSARAFIKISINGKDKYIYADFNLEDNSRSVQKVAQNLKADTENYLKYDDVQRAIIDAYALGELPKFI